MQSTSTRWSSEQIPLGERTDAWEDVLSDSYRRWQVPRRLPATFFAHVRKHDFAGAGIVETVCDPCAGRRTQSHVKQDDELYVGIQLTTAGRERFRIGDAVVDVASGDLVVWTTGQAVEFEVMERLHKVTLMIPWAQMRERLPERRQPPVGGKIESRTGVGSLLAVHLLALSHEIGGLDERVHGSVSRSTLELIGIALSDQQPAGSFDASGAMRYRVQGYILQHLHEEDLNPSRIALANRISLRYLHMLFQRNDMTVSSFILNNRLRACKQALSDPAFARLQISEIAYRWGFNSMSHFCRTFKEKYGSSPGEVRREAAGAYTRRRSSDVVS
ncbi:helix-turn-helix domain-containing protein [Paracidovorax citrulli]|uniref:helix-turn-helix domain-containing protein n=1 Tax=Paracidovorax citrulli TaxID=80869 RepID=UPI00088E918A|nr:helix-turn-helix domain-containing protein [Paracidovorax citrulli]UMT89636.1 helix-turn-helix domain-containing protein [Paracidovorax citrulli]WIY35594.1 helix-turn-helix domain-containing protein [Paracidovorax citrulli]SDJ43043.1 AraC-type DNA-binding protein [Paracidovorax citrulli]